MMQYRIAVVVGSLRRDSWNRKLASAFVTLARPEFSFEQVHIGDLHAVSNWESLAQGELLPAAAGH